MQAQTTFGGNHYARKNCENLPRDYENPLAFLDGSCFAESGLSLRPWITRQRDRHPCSVVRSQAKERFAGLEKEAPLQQFSKKGLANLRKKLYDRRNSGKYCRPTEG